MESIFESLENLPISEECFNDIMDIVEAMLKDRMTMGELREKARRATNARHAQYLESDKEWYGSRNSNAHVRADDRYTRSWDMTDIDKNTYPDNMTISQAQKEARKHGKMSDYRSEAGYILSLGKKKKDIQNLGSKKPRYMLDDTSPAYNHKIFKRQIEAAKPILKEQKRKDQQKQRQAAYRDAKKNGNQLNLLKPNNGVIGKNN